MKFEPAFPYAFQHEDASLFVQSGFSPGISVRDYFAAKIMPAVFTASVQCIMAGGTAQTPDSIARDAYNLADAMLAEREKAK